MTKLIMHRDELAAIRRTAESNGYGLEGDATIVRLLNFIEALPTHSHVYPWASVKAERTGGPPATCTFCGAEAPSRQYRRTDATQEDLAERLGRSDIYRHGQVRDRRYTSTVADGTKGMRRGE